MSDNGWIKLHRKFLDWEWYGDMEVEVLFLHLLLTATRQERRYRGKMLKPGQIATALPDLCERLNMSTKQIRTALSKLEETGEITQKKTNRGRVIAITKWAEYQSVETVPENVEGQTKGRQNDQKRADKKSPASVENTGVCECGEDERGRQRADKRADKGQTKGRHIEQECRERENIENIKYIYIGRLKNVKLTEAEYNEIVATYENPKRLIDKVSLWLANNERDNHFAVVLTFAENANWRRKPIRVSNAEEVRDAIPMPDDIREKLKLWSEKTTTMKS